MRFARWCGVAVALTLLVFGGGYLAIEYDGNFHPVETGVVYRSAQLDGDQLQAVIAQHGIRSVLNLRGPNPGQPWYDAEVAASRALGVTHLDYGISANSRLPLDRMQTILALIEQAPKPILIHCKAGADRTGLVSALYLATHGRSPTDAQAQLSVRYGHVPFGTWSSTRAMDESLVQFLSARGRGTP
ncbi:dual specificity protein phosphatase family protein [Niveibacterium sp.]|uniref:dual specificity protein phosphatase family protein n=1 Tax=Niveibacterium sp. TaxID=2017444 RepID=UPI0035B0D0EC